MYRKPCFNGVVLLGGLILFAGLLHPVHGAAMDFPTRPIQLVVQYPPGGIVDITARLIASKSEEFLGQPIIVLNKPGAGGALGTDFVAKAKPDGYVLGMAPISTFAILPAINPYIKYDPVKDFTPISRFLIISNILLVKADSPLNTIEKLIDYAKKNPGKLNYGSSSVGSSLHFTGELLQRAAGIKMVHVPHKGAAPNLMALLGGHVDLIFSNYIEALEQIKAGKVIPLVMTSPERFSGLPDVPSIAEKGYPSAARIIPWNGIVGPAGLSRPIVDRLSAYCQKVLSLAEMKKKMAELGITQAYTGPDEFAKFIRSEVELYQDLAKKANIKLE